MRELCRKYTDLAEEEIDILIDYGDKLKDFAELTGMDLFIDCLVKGSQQAVVVCHQQPSWGSSLFPESVKGVFVGKETEAAVIRSLTTGMKSKEIKGITQRNRAVRETVIPIHGQGGKVLGVLVREEDVTKEYNQDKQIKLLEIQHQELKADLQYLKTHPKTITDHVSEAVLIFDNKNIAVDVNAEARELYRKLGYLEDIQGQHMENLILDQEAYVQLLKKEVDFQKEVTLGELTLSIRYLSINTDQNNFLVMFMKDVSEIREKEKELILKSVAVKEIHHRVKNNLQTISSILTMQRRRAQCQETKDILMENVMRIQGIAKTHEILASQGIDEINLKELIREVAENILVYSRQEQQQLTLQIEGDELWTDSETASMAALVINELISNSIEHGFEGREKGSIRISIYKGPVFATFAVEDDGQGYEKKENHSSLGMGIIEALVKDKLKGSLRITTGSQGTKTEFNMKMK